MTDNFQLVVALGTLMSSLFAGFASLYNAKCNKTTKQLKQKIERLNEQISKSNKELKDLYLDIHQLLQIEDYLCDELNASKRTVRKPYTFSRRIEKSNIEHRIIQLENK